MKEVKILNGQTFLDIAMQELGDAERAFELANFNNRSITDHLTPGETIFVPTPAIDKKETIKILTSPANRPASKTDDEDNNTPLVPEGIGAWAIDIDFIVS